MARAYDDKGAVTSASRSFIVTGAATAPPTVSLTSPASGASFTAPAKIVLAATAADSDGTVAKVTFFNGSTVIGTDTSSPYTFTWSNVAAGSYTVSAQVTDNSGQVVKSNLASVSVGSAGTPPPTGFYVSPAGSAGGDGSAQRPWDLATALNQPAAVTAGTTIWLRGGTYHGAFISYLRGTEQAPIVVRGYPRERVIIDGRGVVQTTLYLKGSWAIYRDFEVMNSDPKRVSSLNGSSPSDIAREDGVTLYGSNVKLVNVVIHDVADGVGFWLQAENSEVYGCIIFNNGWVGATDGGHGHGLYIQNSTGTKRVVDVISFNNFSTGMKAYATNTDASGVHFEGVASFNNGSPTAKTSGLRTPNLFAGTPTYPIDRITVTNNYLYHPPGVRPELGGNLVMGYNAAGNTDGVVTNNYVIGGAQAFNMRNWASIVVHGNTFHATHSPTSPSASRLVQLTAPAGASYSWPANEYIDESKPSTTGMPTGFIYNGSARVTFDQWKQASRMDTSSSYTTNRPPVPEVFVRPNEYEPGRAHVIVYNWPLESTVDVDLSAVLNQGDAFEVRNVQDYLGAPVTVGTFDGAPIRLPMTGLKVAAPVGHDFTPAAVGPEFNVFVVRKR